MTAFVDVLLRGLLLVCGSLMLGGVLWLRLVLRDGPGVKPDGAARHALGAVAVAAAVAAIAQLTALTIALRELGALQGTWPVTEFLQTTFARTGVGRIAIAAAVAATAVALARGPHGRAVWWALTALSVAFVAVSALMSHAMARLEHRPILVALDAAHQLAAAVWVGGLAHLALWGARGPGSDQRSAREILQRFSALALRAVGVLVIAGIVLAVMYVGDPLGFIGTAYGVMVVTKSVVLAAALMLAAANYLAVRRGTAGARVHRFVEIELGLGVTVLFAAASLTSLPPAADVPHDRASPAEVAARFVPTWPRLVSPPHAELISQADPLMAPPAGRTVIERAWSEYNHHWAGLFVLLMGLGAALERSGVRAARHWPLLFLGLGAFIFVRGDPRAWPLGPVGFWESLTLPDVLQHRFFAVLVVAFAVFEWMVRTERLPQRPWAYVFPLLCAAGGAILLTHSHAMVDVKEEFLTEVTHVPLALLGACAGWARWLELRLPEAARTSGWVWIACLTAVGLLLLGYREG